MAKFKLLTKYNKDQHGGAGGEKIYVNVDNIVTIDINQIGYITITLVDQKTLEVKEHFDEIIN